MTPTTLLPSGGATTWGPVAEGAGVISGGSVWSRSSPLSDNSWFDHAVRELRDLQALRADWDGYGSPSVQIAALASAAIVAALGTTYHVLPAPTIVPVTGGGVQFSWANGERELELEILPDGSLQYLFIDEDGVEEEAGIPRGRIHPISRLFGRIE